MIGTLALRPSYYQALKRLTLELAGVNLGSDHTFLIETRLSALARKEGYGDINEMIDELFSRGQTRLAVHVVSALLERATSFFDDREGFNVLGDKLLPALHPSYRGSVLKILSFGCSSGQEVYSTAILADRLAHVFPDMPIEVTGVDYPSWALERAKEGRFTHFEVQRGLPIRHLIEYFDRDGEDWVVNKALRSKVNFIDHNLLAGTDELGSFQIVMFRGRMKLYSPPAIVRVLRSLSGLLSTHGYLMLGTNEDIGKINYGFNSAPVAPGCFIKLPKRQSQMVANEDLSKSTNPYEKMLYEASLEKKSLKDITSAPGKVDKMPESQPKSPDEKDEGKPAA
jgi:chemotaxis protein methyltransferase CheR